ncbi:hypothetical protein GOV04_00575 [Candidatus Woesearchaeota archaeon]|nr:hypothetical protein [Candidatus Woesearchaeota archaeon]
MDDKLFVALTDTLMDELPPEARRFYKHFQKHKNIELRSHEINSLKQELALRDRVLEETLKASDKKINQLLEKNKKERFWRNVGIGIGIVGVISTIIGTLICTI